MLQLSSGYVHRDDSAVLAWLERLLPVAERLDLLPQTAWAMWRLGSTLYRLDRPRQALVTLRGAHALAVANGLVDVDRNARTSLTYYEQFADPVAGLAMAREGLEIATRRGSKSYGFVMVGNAVSCAIRTGEWAWASSLLDQWLASEITGAFYSELFVDRAVLAALRGDDLADDLAEAERLVADAKDPQFTSYCHWGRAWEAFAAGRLDDARREGIAAGVVTAHFAPISLPLAGRAMLWSGAVAEAGAVADRLDASVVRGQAIDLDRATLRAGIAALEGRRADAIAGYRDALRGWRQLGLGFDEAMAGLDMAILLAPTEREMAEASAAVEAACETLARLGARPFLERLEAARAGAVV
jgi:hypothetical protein